MLEIPYGVREAINTWMHRELEADSFSIAPESEMDIVLATAGCRHPGTMRSMARALRGPAPSPVSIRLGRTVAILPSRQRPRMLLLPAYCVGLSRAAGALMHRMRFGNRVPGRERGFIVLARADAPGGSAPEAPRRLPGAIPGALKEPFNAVRLGLYCSTTMPEGRVRTPLARVELPDRAAVR